MDVVDCLPAIFSRVNNGAVSLGESFRASDLCGGPLQMSEKMFVILFGVSDGGDVLPRDDKDVDGSLRPDVSEGVAVLILIDGFGGDTSVDDLAEYAAHAQESTGAPITLLAHCGTPAGLELASNDLPLFRRSLSGVKEAVDRLREISIEGLNASEWHFDKPMFTGFFHQLSDSI